METQQMRGAVLDAFKREHGDKMIRHMPRKFLVALFAGMGVTTAKNWRTAIRALCQHAVEADMLDEDPTLGIRLRAKKGEGSEGIHTWDEDEIGRFEAVHPIGSRERLAFTLGLSTAQRRGDVMRMGRQHIRQDPQDPNGEVLYVRQKKTGKPLLLPIYPELRAVLDLIPATQMTFLTTARGKPFHRGTSFTQWFRKACDKAGLPAACTFHGLRKAAARRDAEAGCSEKEIAAHTGLASLREVERYTKAADQLRLVRAAMARTAAAREQSGTETVKPGRVRVSNPLSPLRKKPA